MFRKKASERLASPDQLDQLLRVIRPRNWIPLVVLSLVLLSAVLWSVFGSIPVTATGNAILVHPTQVFSFQSPATGELVSLDVHVGDEVRKDQPIGRLNLPDLQKQLEQARLKLEGLHGRRKRMSQVEQEQAEQEGDYIQNQREFLQKRIDDMKDRADGLRDKSLAYVREQNKKLGKARTLSEQLQQDLEKRVQSYETAEKEGLTTLEARVRAQQDLVETKLRLSEIDVKEHEVALLELRALQTHAAQMDRIAELQIKQEELGLREMEIKKRLLEASQDNETREEDLNLEIARLEGLVDSRGVIVAEHPGRILEIAVSVGTIIARGQRIGAMEVEDPTKDLVALAYFPVREGKKIRPDMSARVTPSTVQRQKYGSIRGSITKVSDYLVTLEGAINQVGNRDMARILTAGGKQIEVRAVLQRGTSHGGYVWTSGDGPDQPITAGTTASIRVTIERRAPISFILPILRDWAGAGG